MKPDNSDIPLNEQRRDFITTSGQLVIGFCILQLPFSTQNEKTGRSAAVARSAIARSAGDPKAIDSWIRVDTNGNVTVLTGKMELGQGVKTALMQIAAEELDVEMSKVRIITADTGQTPNERYTAGSASIESSGKSIRMAAAEARKKLIQLAAEKLEVPVSDLITENGLIKAGKSGKFVGYGDLLQGKMIEGEVTGNAPLKSPGSYKLVGAAIPREDITAMATGKAFYIHDMRLPSMVHARIVRPPAYLSRLVSVPIQQASSLPGVLKIVQDGNFIAVIASGEYQAIKAMNFIRDKAIWDSKSLSPLADNLFDDMRKNGGRGEVITDHAEISSALDSAVLRHEAEYQRPYHMHGSIGPSCAIALWDNDALTIWSHTQGVYPLRQTVANLLSLPEEKIRVIGVPGAGCYGHNGADDVGGEAALLAMQMPGKPVRLQWMREDEHRWEPYGSAMMIKLNAGLNAQQKVQSWKTELWSDTHSTRPGGRAGHFIAARSLEKLFSFSPGGFSGGSTRNSIPLYDFPSQIVLHNYQGPLRTSALRSLGAYANIFALESFMDELAIKARVDPVEFRLRHLKDERAREVIQTLAKKVHWGSKKSSAASAMGFAFAQYKNEAAYFAAVAEVSLDRTKKRFKVTRLTGCIDAGQIINPDGIENQTSGGMIQSASWTLFEQVRYDGKEITSSNWETYPILRFLDVPDTEVLIIDRPTQEPLGAGEAAQGPTSAAIANAIFAATGSRIRQLPLTPDKIDWSRKF